MEMSMGMLENRFDCSEQSAHRSFTLFTYVVKWRKGLWGAAGCFFGDPETQLTSNIDTGFSSSLSSKRRLTSSKKKKQESSVTPTYSNK